MALSKDPAKRDAQLANLAAGRRKLAETLLGQGPAKDPPPPPAKASKGPAKDPPAKAPAKARAKAGKGSDPDRVSYPEEKKPRARSAPREPAPRRQPGFIDGILGRL